MTMAAQLVRGGTRWDQVKASPLLLIRGGRGDGHSGGSGDVRTPGQMDALPAVTPSIPLIAPTLTSCLSLPMMITASLAQHGHVSTLPPPHNTPTSCSDPSQSPGPAHPLPGPHLPLDPTPHRHLKLRASKMGVITPQTCSPCRAPFSAKAPPSTRL